MMTAHSGPAAIPFGMVPPDWIAPPDLHHARIAQAAMAERVIVADEPAGPALVAGVDVSNAPRDPAAPVYAAVVTLKPDRLIPTGGAGAARMPRFPYVPGFLGFREVPALLDAFGRLDAPPDLLLVDGHGVSHPRGLGIATHLGVVLDRPAIGVAKSILVGQPAGTLGDRPGSRVDLVWRGQVIGAVLRTKPRCNPVYVSVGHRVSLEGAVGRVMAMLRGYRLPEPTRHAHRAANALRRAGSAAAQTPLEDLLEDLLGRD